MNVSRQHGTYIQFDERHEKMISEIIKRTGERKVDFFKRIVETEHTRIIQGASITESVNETLGMLLAQINEMNSTMKTLLDNTKATRDGVNTIFPATLFLMRELYRLTHFIVNVFIKNGMLQPQQMTAFITESNAQACQSFNAFYHTVMNTSSKGIVELLKKSRLKRKALYESGKFVQRIRVGLRGNQNVHSNGDPDLRGTPRDPDRFSRLSHLFQTSCDLRHDHPDRYLPYTHLLFRKSRHVA